MIYLVGKRASRNLSISNDLLSDWFLIISRKPFTYLDQSNIGMNILLVISWVTDELTGQIDLESWFLFGLGVWFLNVSSSQEDFAFVHASMLKAMCRGDNPRFWDNRTSTKVFSTLPKSNWNYPWPWTLLIFLINNFQNKIQQLPEAYSPPMILVSFWRFSLRAFIISNQVGIWGELRFPRLRVPCFSIRPEAFNLDG